MAKEAAETAAGAFCIAKSARPDSAGAGATANAVWAAIKHARSTFKEIAKQVLCFIITSKARQELAQNYYRCHPNDLGWMRKQCQSTFLSIFLEGELCFDNASTSIRLGDTVCENSERSF
jgi:hypothetical protein